MLRHYCIEGKRHRLSDEPYELPHVTNGDFLDGTTGWAVETAAKESVRIEHLKRFFWMRNLYCLEPLADRILVMKRVADAPNRISREIKALQPGRVYSLKLFTADHGDLTGGKSDEKKMAVSIEIDGAEELADGNEQYVYSNSRWHRAHGFNRDKPAWFNYHIRRFRAKAPSARLTISDWSGGGEPGGPIGQETIVSGVRVEPVMPE